jgi:hypothetical protein
MERCRLDSIVSGQDPMAEFCEKGNQNSSYMKTRNILIRLATISFSRKALYHGISVYKSRQNYVLLYQFQSRDSSVGMALGYGLDDRGSGVRFPAGAGNSFLHHRVQNGSGAHPASYPMGTRDSFPGGKAAGA